ncbi:MAG TPA: gamma-glutamylcyclotransferase family protein [bacterium]
MANYPTPYVFVYDVFMKDCVKHVKIASNVKSWARAEMPGKLYQLATGLPIAVEEEGGKVFGEVMTFQDMDEAMEIIDAQEGYRPEAPNHGPLIREVREITVTATGEKMKALVYLFPKEKFNALEMRAINAHGGDWRKFVMMPRFDGYQH